MKMDDLNNYKELWPKGWSGKWMRPEFEEGLVSVIIPTYNRAHFLKDALDSVVSQTYRPIEVLIVDDGSTDETESMVEYWRSEVDALDFQARYIRQENGGAPKARNRGLLESRGEFIQFLDSDDVLHPEKLSRQVACLRESDGVDYVYGLHSNFSREVSWVAANTFDERPDSLSKYLELVFKGYINTVVGLYRRTLCVKNGPWNELMNREQDTEYTLRFILCGLPLGAMPEVAAAIRMGNECQITATKSLKQLGEIFFAHQLVMGHMIKTGVYEGAIQRRMSRSFFAFARDFAFFYGRDGLEHAQEALSHVNARNFSRLGGVRYGLWSKILNMTFGRRMWVLLVYNLERIARKVRSLHRGML